MGDKFMAVWPRGIHNRCMTKLKAWADAQTDSVAAIAASVAVHRVTFYKIIRGERMPSAELALRIETRTGGAVTVRDLAEAHAAFKAARA